MGLSISVTEMAMNKYLVKIASFVKQAWDSDYEDGSEYGVMANRATRSDDVYGALTKAMLDKDLHVTVEGDGPSGAYEKHSSKDNPKGLLKMLDHVKSVAIAAGSDHNKTAWHRDYVWSIGMDKSHPILKTYLGKEDNGGWPIEDEGSAILHHISSKYSM